MLMTASPLSLYQHCLTIADRLVGLGMAVCFLLPIEAKFGTRRPENIKLSIMG